MKFKTSDVTKNKKIIRFGPYNFRSIYESKSINQSYLNEREN